MTRDTWQLHSSDWFLWCDGSWQLTLISLVSCSSSLSDHRRKQCWHLWAHSYIPQSPFWFPLRGGEVTSVWHLVWLIVDCNHVPGADCWAGSGWGGLHQTIIWSPSRGTVTLYTLTSSTTLAVTGVFPPVCRLRREEVLLISRSTNDTTLTLISSSKWCWWRTQCFPPLLKTLHVSLVLLSVLHFWLS